MIPFNPSTQPNTTLSGAQKYLLRLVYGWAGRTVLHGERLVEICETHDHLRQLFPLAESDLSESTDDPFWVPRREEDDKRFNTERRDTSRRHVAIGSGCGEPRPKYARRVPFRSVFPSPSYLQHLVTELGYDADAALAAFAGPQRFHGRPDRRRKIAVGGADEQAERRRNGKPNRDYQRLDYGKNLYIPTAPIRRTLTGGGFTEKQVSQGLARMRTDGVTKTALIEIVHRRRSTLEVSNMTGIPVEKLYVYASRLRGHIREQSAVVAG